mmetsp:Transcript_24023/g.33023  ORF Transcript_24023/g.33023 Transcript_24023/m.33023 type:complete len:825 (+) Transcript_24023:50-2524(+)
MKKGTHYSSNSRSNNNVAPSTSEAPTLNRKTAKINLTTDFMTSPSEQSKNRQNASYSHNRSQSSPQIILTPSPVKGSSNMIANIMTNLKRFSPQSDVQKILLQDSNSSFKTSNINRDSSQALSEAESDCMESQDTIDDRPLFDSRKNRCLFCIQKDRVILTQKRNLENTSKLCNEQIAKIESLESTLASSNKDHSAALSLLEIEIGCNNSKLSENEYKMRELTSLNQLQDSVIQNNREELSKTRKQYDAEIEHLRQTISDQKYQIRQLLDQNRPPNARDESDITINTSKNEVRDFRQAFIDSQRTIDEWSAKYKAVEARLAEAVLELLSLKGKNAESHDTNEATERSLDQEAAMHTLYTEMKQQHEKDVATMQDMSALLHSQENSLVALQEEMQQNKSKYELSLKSVKESALQDHQKKISELKASHEKQLQAMNASLTRANDKAAELAEVIKQQEIQQRSKKSTESYNLKDYLLFAQSEITSLNAQLSHANERIQQLEAIHSHSTSSSSSSKNNSTSTDLQDTRYLQSSVQTDPVQHNIASHNNMHQKVSARSKEDPSFSPFSSIDDRSLGRQQTYDSSQVESTDRFHSSSSSLTGMDLVDNRGGIRVENSRSSDSNIIGDSSSTVSWGRSFDIKANKDRELEKKSHRSRKSRQLIRIELKEGEEPDQAMLSRGTLLQHSKAKSLSAASSVVGDHFNSNHSVSSTMSNTKGSTSTFSSYQPPPQIHANLQLQLQQFHQQRQQQQTQPISAPGQYINPQQYHQMQFQQQVQQHVQQQVQQHIQQQHLLQQQQAGTVLDVDRQNIAAIMKLGGLSIQEATQIYFKK